MADEAENLDGYIQVSPALDDFTHGHRINVNGLAIVQTFNREFQPLQISIVYHE